jgi:hypothetical protein
MNYVGIDWAYRRAAWCALTEEGRIEGEGMVAADEDGLARLVLGLGTEIKACVETMSGAVWVKDQLETAGWSVSVANARKVRDVAPLAADPADRSRARADRALRSEGEAAFDDSRGRAVDQSRLRHRDR